MTTAAPVRLERRLLTLVIFLLVIGHVMLFSATGVLAAQRYGNEFYYVLRQAIAAVTGLLLMVVLSHVKYQRWQKWVLPLLIVQVITLALTLVPPFGHTAQGASRWLHIGALAFQPSELAKITIPLYASHFLAQRPIGQISLIQWGWHALLIVVPLLLMLQQPDLGSTILLATLIVGLLFVAGVKPRYFGAIIGIATLALGLGLWQSGYRRRRLLAFLNPWTDPQGSGFQAIQSFISFHSGKLLGVGIGNGNSKLFYLPEVHTDFIFALIGEELGFVGALAILAIFVYFGYLLFKVSSHAPDPFGGYLAFAFGFLILLQVAVNLGGVTGILPVKGLPLPFISWGRSALWVNLAMIGITLNILKQCGPKQRTSL